MVRAMFTMRFDMRAPGGVDTMPALYEAAIDMAEWAEGRGGVACVISEHHASPDGYIPSPLLLASAIAARTKHMPIAIAAALMPFYDPIRLAEDIAVLDIISKGRVSYVMALGYRPEEFAMFGVDWDERGAVAEQKLTALLQALRGEPFEYEGRRVQVTPTPPNAVQLSWGGGTKAAARRAGRHGLGFFAETNGEGLLEAYQSEARAHGHEPGSPLLPEPGSATTVFVANDVDRAWEEIGPHMLHDATTYGGWNVDKENIASMSSARTVDEMRAEEGSYRIYPVDEAVEIVTNGGMLLLQPLCGGLPPDVAWKYLRVVTDDVIPKTR
jgi:alkanesulfonate monooxygenase SsuD/methylene tetrahydromethanopterin reductase-like flavin-dependent oxidoreductase (luciferase family)